MPSLPARAYRIGWRFGFECGPASRPQVSRTPRLLVKALGTAVVVVSCVVASATRADACQTRISSGPTASPSEDSTQPYVVTQRYTVLASVDECRLIPTSQTLTSTRRNFTAVGSVAGVGVGVSALAVGDLFDVTLSLTWTNDDQWDGDDTCMIPVPFSFNFSEINGSGCVSMIEDDAAPTVTVTASVDRFVETDGETDVVLTATLSAVIGLTTSVVVALSGTATSGTDYTVAPDPVPTITIIAGDLSATGTVTLDPVQDDLTETGGETVVVGGTAASHGTMFTLTGTTLTISDPPLTVTLTTSVDRFVETDGETDVVLTATLSSTLSTTTTVVITLGGTATGGGTDYTVDPDPVPSISISAGERSGTVTVEVDPVQDDVTEGDETVVVAGTATSGTMP